MSCSGPGKEFLDYMNSHLFFFFQKKGVTKDASIILNIISIDLPLRMTIKIESRYAQQNLMSLFLFFQLL